MQIIVHMNFSSWKRQKKTDEYFQQDSNDGETDCLEKTFVRLTEKESLLVKSVYFSMSIFISSVYRQYVSYYL